MSALPVPSVLSQGHSEHLSPPAGRTTSTRTCSVPATTWVPSTGAEGSTPKPCAAWRGPESVHAS